MIRRLLFIPALIGVAISRPALADQQISWLNYCTAGSLQMCASVYVTVVPSGAGQTYFTVKMRNLQGQLGTTPYRLFNLGFWGLKTDKDLWTTFAMSPSATLSGNAHLHVDSQFLCSIPANGPCPGPSWGQTEWFYTRGTSGRGFVYWTTEDAMSFQNSIQGCDVLNDYTGPHAGSFQTCGDGWVEASFSLKGNWEFDESSYLDWFGRDVNGNTVECIADANCVNTAPEPVTIALLSTGLLGIGAVRRRKSRAVDV